ncbi:DUF1289 domain-containing protein [Sphingobium sp. KCTC 72723]|uniref:DUF1289 domain-containing protein n=1 Tax=Sphingobium sp. KCTC 72723 TaxID=2733867 RepID=UPI00165E24CC|nr:DUF1289 domain-containing protein [Sphingobium sp. KCTC 72723]
MNTPPVTPCRNLCQLDAARATCTGCGRTIDEIVHWRSMGDAARAAVMTRVQDFQPLPHPSAFSLPARRTSPSS